MHISCEKSKALCLAEPGLTAGRQTGWLIKLRSGLKILLLVIDQNIQFSAVLSQGTALFKQFLSIAKAFLGKHYYIVI